MLRKSLLILALVTLFGAVAAVPARAQQTVSFNLGYLWVTGVQGRYGSANAVYPGDVLWTELNGDYYNALDFRMQGFNNVTFGGDWLISLGDFLEAGAGISYYSRSVPSRSLNIVWDVSSDPNAPPPGSDILQTLRLRMIPITGSVRFLPLGRHAVVEPYVGGGVSLINYRYIEEGDFVDATDVNALSIFNGTYEHSGWAVGPLVLGGIRVPFGAFVVGGEYKYQWGKGTLPTTGDSAFLSDHVDLSGSTFQVTFGYRF